MRLRTPTLIGIAALVGAAGYFGWKLWADAQVNAYELKAIPPGTVNLVAVTPESGYTIIVANKVAHLAELSESNLAAPDQANESDIISKKRLLIREMLGSLRGEADSLGKFIMALNDINESDFPPTRVYWTVEQVEAAINGDPDLKPRLEAALHTRLDGTPLSELNLSRLGNGIVLQIPVSMEIPVGDEVRTIETVIEEPFRTNFAVRTDRVLSAQFRSDEQLNVLYQTEVQKTLGQMKNDNGDVIPADIENVVANLRRRYSDARIAELKEKPKQVLDHAYVVVSEDQMTSASSNTYKAGTDAEITDINLSLTDDGRMRLWKYSRENPGFQLLFIVNGVALAAPTIKSDLAEHQVVIRRVGSQRLAEEAAEEINQHSEKS